MIDDDRWAAEDVDYLKERELLCQRMEKEWVNVDDHLKNPKYDQNHERQREIAEIVRRELPKWFTKEQIEEIYNDDTKYTTSE